MKRLLVILLAVSIAAFMPKPKKQRIVFFGDSITQAGANPGGYIMRIDSMCTQEGLKENYDFIGAGISGNKVYDSLFAYGRGCAGKKPRYGIHLYRRE
ncbi:hypothetical protein [Ferruginibacter sp.]